MTALSTPRGAGAWGGAKIRYEWGKGWVRLEKGRVLAVGLDTCVGEPQPSGKPDVADGHQW